MNIKELYQRSHKKCGYDSSHACYGGNLRDLTACDHKKYASYDDTDQIRYDPDILELTLFPGIYDNKRNRVICGNAKIRGHIESRPEADDDNAHNKTDNSYRH